MIKNYRAAGKFSGTRMIASVYVGNGLCVRFSFLRHIRLPAHKSCLQKALGLPRVGKLLNDAPGYPVTCCWHWLQLVKNSGGSAFSNGIKLCCHDSHIAFYISNLIFNLNISYRRGRQIRFLPADLFPLGAFQTMPRHKSIPAVLFCLDAGSNPPPAVAA